MPLFSKALVRASAETNRCTCVKTTHARVLTLLTQCPNHGPPQNSDLYGRDLSSRHGTVSSDTPTPPDVSSVDSTVTLTSPSLLFVLDVSLRRTRLPSRHNQSEPPQRSTDTLGVLRDRSHGRPIRRNSNYPWDPHSPGRSRLPFHGPLPPLSLFGTRNPGVGSGDLSLQRTSLVHPTLTLFHH